MPRTKEELQQYIHSYKLDVLQKANEDSEKMFERSNMLEQKIGSDLIVFASVLLTIMGGIIASKDLVLSHSVKIILTISVLSLLLSILAGLMNYRVTSNFWQTLGDAAHERGGLVYYDKSKTFKDLEKLREAMIVSEAEPPRSSPKKYSVAQIVCFGVGIVVVTLAIIGILFDFDMSR